MSRARHDRGAGALIVRTRRARLRSYLEEIERAASLPSRTAALQTLDGVDEKFDDLLARGKLNEGQHAVLEQRIAMAGYELFRSGAGR